MGKKKPLVKCKFCGTVGRTKTEWRGSKFVERFLWVTLLFPGPLYTFWRWQGRKEVCAYCGSENFAPVPPAELSPEMLDAIEKDKKPKKKERDLGYEEHRF
jgi:hypothetical protein